MVIAWQSTIEQWALAVVSRPAQARASDDYVASPYVGVDNWRIGGQSILINALGLAPSKVDTLPSPHLIISFLSTLAMRREILICKHQDSAWVVVVIADVNAVSAAFFLLQDSFWSSYWQPGNPYGEERFEPYARLQAAVTTLSAGPVAIADGVDLTDVALVLRSCMKVPCPLRPHLINSQMQHFYI